LTIVTIFQVADLEGQISTLESERDSLQSELLSVREELEVAREDIKIYAGSASEAEGRYQHEVMQHGKCMEELFVVKEKVWHTICVVCRNLLLCRE